MFRSIYVLAILLSMNVGCTKSLESDKDKVSYLVGQQIGKQIQSQGLEVNPKVLAMSIADVLGDKKSRMTPDEMAATMGLLQKQIQESRKKLAEADKKKAEENKVKEVAFLKENSEKKDVNVTSSGLQYKVIKAADGKKPVAADRVKVHYRGTLLDKTEFDSSYKRNEPAVFGLKQVIPGWTEGLQLMTVGSKYQFFIPAGLAYGEQGRPGIPPNSTLIFDVELLSIEK